MRLLLLTVLSSSWVWQFTAALTELTFPPEGYINLTRANSPYVVSENLTASGETEIFIESGVKVFVRPGLTVTISGSFHSFGTKNDPVVWDSLEGEDYHDSNFSSTLQFYSNTTDHFVYKGQPICSVQFVNSQLNTVVTRKSTKESFIGKTICSPMGFASTAELLGADMSEHAISQDWLGLQFRCQLNAESLDKCRVDQTHCNSGTWFKARCNRKSFHHNWGGLHFSPDNDRVVSLDNMQVLNAGNQEGLPTAAIKLPNGRYEVNTDGLMVNNSFGVGVSVDRWNISGLTVNNCNQGGILSSLSIGSAPSLDRCQLDNNRNFGLKVASTSKDVIDPVSFCASDPVAIVNMTEFDLALHFTEQSSVTCTRDFFIDDGNLFSFQFFPRQYSNYLTFKVSGRNNLSEPYESLFAYSTYQVGFSRYDYRFIRIQIWQYSSNSYDLLTAAIPRNTHVSTISRTLVVANDVGLLFATDESFVTYHLAEARLLHNQIGIQQPDVGQTLLVEDSMIDSSAVGLVGQFTNVLISNSNFTNCSIGLDVTTTTNPNFMQSTSNSVVIENCLIEGNEVGVRVTAEKSLESVTIKNVKAMQNHLMAVHITADTDLVEVRDSVFLSNRGSGTVMVNTVNGVKQGQLLITSCDFIDNSVDNLPHFQVDYGSNAVVKTNHHTNASINQCRFENPNSQYEVSLSYPYYDPKTANDPSAPFYNKKVLDFTNNWWGTTDVTDAALKIYDRNVHVTLQSTRLSPFYDTPEMTNLRTGDFRLLRGTELGGVLNGEAVIPPGEYQVVGDIFVTSAAKLTLQPGVTLIFPPTSTLVVHGQLVSDAIDGDNINLNLQVNATMPVQSGFRLTDRRVNIASNGTSTDFGTVCIEDASGTESYPTAATLCRWGGLKETGATYYSASTSIPAKFSRIRCGPDVSNPHQCVLTPCGQDEKDFCTSCQLLAVSCPSWGPTELTWEGVELSPVARPSIIRNTKITGANGGQVHTDPSALRIGYHRHEISNITIESDNPILISNISVLTPLTDVSATPSSDSGTTGITLNRPFDNAEFFVDPESLLDSCGTNTLAKSEYKILWLFKSTCYTTIEAFNTNMSVLLISTNYNSRYISGFHIQLVYPNGTHTQEVLWNSRKPLLVTKGQQLRISQTRPDQQSILQLIGSSDVRYLSPGDEISIHRTSVGKFTTGLQLLNYPCFNYQLDELKMQSGIHVSMCRSYGDSGQHMSFSVANSQFSGPVPGQKRGIALYTDCVTDVLSIRNCTMSSLETAVQVSAASANISVDRSIISKSFNAIDIRYTTKVVVLHESNIEESDYGITAGTSDQLTIAFCNISGSNTGVSASSISTHLKLIGVRMTTFSNAIKTAMQQGSAMGLEDSLIEGMASGTGILVTLYPSSQVIVNKAIVRSFGTAIACQLDGTGSTPSLMAMSITDSFFGAQQREAVSINQQSCAGLNLTIENVEFYGNGGGVKFMWYDTSGWSLVIKNSTFTSGADYITGTDTNNQRCHSASDLGRLSIVNNRFEKSNVGMEPTSAAVRLYSDINIHMNRNTFVNSDGRLTLDVFCTISSNEIVLSYNVFSDNRMQLGLVDIATCHLSMTHNTFINNSWPHVTSDDPCSDPSLKKLLSTRQTCSRLNATLNMRLSELPDEFHHNIFSNNAKPEMYLTFDTFPPTRNWDGSHNYWGENLGFEAAIVLENGNVRPRVTLSPVFTSTDMIETAEGRIDPAAFKSPHENFDTATGAFTSDTTLDTSGSPYDFQQDVYVPVNVTLTVEKGVTLNFAHRTRLLVDGNLVAEGSADNTIVFNTAEQNLPGACSKRFRIEESTNLLQALHSGQWYYVQAQNSQFSILDICYYIYRSFPLSGTTISKGTGSYPTTYVNCAHFSEESSCSIYLTYNTPADVWVLQCGQQSQWEGICIRSAQNDSVLKHIEIRNAGATRQGEMGVALQTSGDLKQMSQVRIVRSGGSGVYLKSLTHDNPLNPNIVSDISTTDIAGVSLLWPRQYSLNVSKITGLNVGLAGVVQLSAYNNFNGIREPTAIVGDFAICQSFPVNVPSGRRRFLSNNRVNLWLPSRLCCEMIFVTEPTFNLVFYIQIPTYCGITFTDSESNPVSPTSYYYYYYQGNYLTAYETYASSVRMNIFCSGPTTPFEMFVESQKAVWHDRLEDNNQLLVDFDTTRVSVIKIPDGYRDFNPGNAQGHVLSINHSSTSLDPANLLTSIEMDFRDICFMTVARAVFPKPQYPHKVLHQISLLLNNGSSYNLHRSNATLSSQFEKFGVDLTKFSTESTVGKLQFRIDVTSDYDAEIWFDDFAIIPCNRWYKPSSSLASLNFKNVGDNGIHLTTDNSTEVSLHDSYFESVGLSHALPTNYHLERAAISLGDLTSSYITSDVHISNVHVTKANVPLLQINSAKTVHLHNNSFVDNVVVTGTDVFNIATQTSQMSHNIIADNRVKTNQFLTIIGSMSAIQHSYFSNNTCITCSSLLYTYGLQLTADKNVVIDNNFTYSPSLQGILYFYASPQTNWHNSFIYNQLCNSQSKCPVEVSSTSTHFNVSYNYWNTEVDDDVVPRIHPNVDTDPFLPIIRQPPQIYGLNSFSCNAHELELSGFCWYTSPGFVPCEKAKSICDAKGTSMAALSSIQLHQSTLEHVAGGHSFWLLSETSHDCLSYTRETNEGDTAALANFQQLSSVLCVREAVSSCPATCVSPRGVCKGFLCSCKPGWTGWDCLKPVCPRQCSGNGECTADGCICIPGWYGDACSITRCPIYVDCVSCTKAPNCGWCDETSKCVPGNAYGTVGNTTINHCKNFFFYGCTTADDSTGCSSSVAKLDCLDRFCGEKEFDEFACMRCQDIQDCYAISTDEKSCRLWNETRCPGGKIAPDYSDGTRGNKTRIKKGVVTIGITEPLIYKCSFKQDSIVLVSKGNRWDLVNKTVISAQAGGFILKTGEMLKLGDWSFVGATKASLADVIDYADFQNDGESSSYGDIIDSASVDDSAIGLLMELSLEQPAAFVSLQSAAVVYKMVGETVRNDSNGIEVHSLVLVVPKGLTFNGQPGTVVFANGTYPYVETVEAVDQITETTKLATTKLHEFATDDLTLTTDKLDTSGSRQYACSGGSHWTGIAAFKTESPIWQNDIIIGRQSGSFAIRIVEIQMGDEFQFIIGWPLVDISGNGSYTTLHSAIQRSSFTTGISLHEEIDCKKYFGDPGNCTAYVNVESQATLQLNIDLHYTKYPFIEGGVGLQLTTTAESGLSLHYSKLRARFDSSQPIFTTKPVIANIPIFGVPIPIGTIGFVTLEMSAEFDPGVGVNMSAGVSVNHVAVVSLGSTSLGNSRQETLRESFWNDFQLLKSGETFSNPRGSLSFFLKVGVRSQFPYLSQLKQKLLDAVDELPDYLQPLVKAVADEVKLDISVDAYAGPSLRLDATICGCTSATGSCSHDPLLSQNSLQLRIGPIVGVIGGGQFMGYSANLPIERSFYLYDNQQCIEPNFDSCSTAQTETNCGCSCLGLGLSGIRNLDGSCSCPCFCYCTRCDGTSKSELNWRGKCDCGDCDDGKCCDRHPDYSNCPTDKPDPPIDNGLSPACPPYKMGPDCTDLDCSYGNGCSGHGFCAVDEDKQKTRCSCNSPFEGQRCQNVIPTAHGDPHLATRDGFYYDFMGLGEYWYCRSNPFQLRIQSRFFKDSRWNASYIGGMAVNLRDVTVSVVTAIESTGSFKLRINGAIVSSLGDIKSLSNGSATLTADSSRISLEFQTGETFGWNVVKRSYAQWLEFSYSLTSNYDGKTKGLCGDGDGDINNDFTGPDGMLYSNAWDFGYSWKVADGESIYHPDDKMDDRYEDKPGEHRLNPSDINSTDIYRQAKSECESQHFSLAILTDMCILDVVVTNDTENVNQQGLKASSCPNSCSGRGDCQRDNTCECITGWSGEECNERQCNPECSDFGQCVDGFCKCQNGYEGLDCAKQTDCANLNNCTDPLHGICVSTGVCQCNGGFSGPECSQTADCTSLNGCSGNGKCVNNEKCLCDTGYKGKTCDTYSCEVLNSCSGHGRCDGFDVCVCNSGYSGLSCLQFACPNDCSGNGRCTGPLKCDCYAGYTGDDCATELHCATLNNCTSQGACVAQVDNMIVTTEVCRCFSGYSGLECAEVDCSEEQNCSGHGWCREPNLCVCDEGYTGANCNSFTCLKVSNCFGNGNCTALDTCECSEDWSGADCSIPACNNCSSSTGRCIGSNKCQCLRGFTGSDCSTPIQSNNRYDPEFSQSSYSVTISTDVKVGSVVLVLMATDRDTGDSAKISYAIAENSGWAREYFTVGKSTGQIIVTSSLSTFGDVVKVIQIFASDSGYPVRSASTTVSVTIRSPKCTKALRQSPTQFIAQEQLVDNNTFVMSVATEDSIAVDSVIYSFSDTFKSQSASKYFRLDNVTGELFIVDSSIPSQRYYVGVEAAQKDLPCSAATTAQVLVIAKIDPLITTTERPTRPTSTTSTPTTTSFVQTTSTKTLPIETSTIITTKPSPTTTSSQVTSTTLQSTTTTTFVETSSATSVTPMIETTTPTTSTIITTPSTSASSTSTTKTTLTPTQSTVVTSETTTTPLASSSSTTTNVVISTSSTAAVSTSTVVESSTKTSSNPPITTTSVETSSTATITPTIETSTSTTSAIETTPPTTITSTTKETLTTTTHSTHSTPETTTTSSTSTTSTTTSTSTVSSSPASEQSASTSLATSSTPLSSVNTEALTTSNSTADSDSTVETTPAVTTAIPATTTTTSLAVRIRFSWAVGLLILGAMLHY